MRDLNVLLAETSKLFKLFAVAKRELTLQQRWEYAVMCEEIDHYLKALDDDTE